VAKIMKPVEGRKLSLGKTDLDALFEKYLKPLRSKNARTIFKILVKEKKVKSMTTLDIQTKLDEIGIIQSKKEINGWLHSLNVAELAIKDEERGKPTTIDYDDKYTFDHWRLTDFGIKIAENLPSVLGTMPTLVEEDIETLLNELTKIEIDRRAKILKKLDELNMIVKLLLYFLETGSELNKTKLMKKLEPPEKELDNLISKYSNQDRGPTLMIRKPQKPGLITKVFCLLGLSHNREEKYYLTEEGRRIAEAILS